MASAAFEGGSGTGSAIHAAGRSRSRLRGLTGATGAPCARRRGDSMRRARRDSGAFLRGIGASLLIASGYVAFVSGVRWLLGA